MDFVFEQEGRRSVQVAAGVIAGWTARDSSAVEHHIGELAALGVPRPSTVPLFYRVASALFTTASRIEVVGTHSSGEVEPVLYSEEGRLWLGLGSDHTDRKLESHSVALSKQVCAKPVAPTFWAFAEVEDHLDRLELRSWMRQRESEEWTLYQQGSLAAMRPLLELAGAAPLATQDGNLPPATIMMCGTLGVLAGGVRASRFFRVELKDPVRGRTIEHAYETLVLPVIS